jgi:hypothetical protein
MIGANERSQQSCSFKYSVEKKKAPREQGAKGADEPMG